jgi:hypothetical protein
MVDKTARFGDPKVLESTAGGVIIEIALQGEDLGPSSYNIRHIKDGIETRRPAAIVVNLGDTEILGDDIDPLVVELIRFRLQGVRACSFVATGSSARSLVTLLEIAKITDAFGICCFTSLQGALEFCRQRLREAGPA